MLRRLTFAEAVSALKAGEVVVFPTETSYSLGCRAFDEVAVSRVVAAKQRPDGKPLAVLLSSVQELRRRSPETPLLALAEAFWPGPLTLVVPAFPGLPAQITADTNMVGVKVSGHPVTAALVGAIGEPLAATSANRTGADAPTTPEACDAAGLGAVYGLLEAGALAGAASTVLGLVDGALKFHRHGCVPEDALRARWAASREVC